MNRPTCTLSCIVSVVFCALALAACGGSKNLDATAVLDKTFGADSGAVKSGKLNLAVAADVKGIPSLKDPLRLGLSGPFRSAKEKGALPSFDFTLSLASSGSTLTAGAISTGEKGFLKFQGQSFAVTDQLFEQFKQGYATAQKTSQDQDKNASTLSSLGVDPRRWLTNPRKLDNEDVGGTSSYHVAAGISVPKLLADLDRVLQKARTAAPGASSRITPAQQKKILDQVTAANVDVWSGVKDLRLRKLVLDLRLKTGTVKVSLQLDNLGEDVKITAPANARPLEELLAAVQGGAAAVPGGSAPTTSPAPGATTTQPPAQSAPSSPAQSPEYLKCVQSAGQDIAKLQGCAKLIASG